MILSELHTADQTKSEICIVKNSVKSWPRMRIPDVRQLSIPALPNNLLMHLHDVKSSDKETQKYFPKYLFKIII